jgi:hypothetical protein
VRAPQERRSLNDIVDAALKVIDPPAADREEWRAKVAVRIDGLQRNPPEHLRTRDIKKNLAAYEKALRTTRKAAEPFVSFINIDEFLKHLEHQIEVVEEFGRIKYEKEKGAKLLDLGAEEAVRAARDLIWERGLKPTASPKSAWHRLSQLLNESASGTAGKGLMHYLRNWKPEEPTHEQIEEEITRLRNDA